MYFYNAMKKTLWITKHFDDLTSTEIYDMFVIRQQVFIVEQDCAYQDVDDKDKNSYHLFGYNGSYLSAYLRIVPPKISYKEVSIGRVLTSKSDRNLGLGKILMKKGINEVERIFKTKIIRISAQTYLIKFYKELGFIKVGEPYLEDDIPHIEMILMS